MAENPPRVVDFATERAAMSFVAVRSCGPTRRGQGLEDRSAARMLRGTAYGFATIERGGIRPVAEPPELPGTPTGTFPTTDWCLILRSGDCSGPEARDVLATLCQAYWYLIYALIRPQGHDPDDAQDLAQDYFPRLLFAAIKS